jgi:tRNA(fMet)-specific endonuclease VapC
MSFLIDTDIASAYVRGVGLVQNRFLQYTGWLSLSVVTFAELKIWLYRKNTPNIIARELASLEQQVSVMEMDNVVADKAVSLGASLLDGGITVALPDLLIAATALVHGLTLVTHNTQDFQNILGLMVVDWLAP